MKTRFLPTLLISFWLVTLTTPLFSQYKVTSSSYLGGADKSGRSDRVYGSEILKDGTIVLAANLGESVPGGGSAQTLNGATASSPGAIVRLSGDGKTVLSVTRISDHVSDLSVDGADRLYVAAGEGGAVVLNSTASEVLQQVSYPARAHRIDATPSGEFVVLVSGSDYDDKLIREATLYLYGADGNQLKSWSGGMQYTTDACVDEATKTVVAIGFSNITAKDDSQRGSNPVDVASYRGWDFSGNQKYRGYSWNGTRGDPRWINQPENNMADTRGARCSVGDDGKLYMSFAADGGNHIFRYSPFNVRQSVGIVGGDKYHQFFSSRTEKKTFFGRYDMATGAYLKGQQFCARVSSGNANTAHPELGDIKADADGNVYVVGQSAFGLPVSYDPLPSAPPRGAFILIMDPDFTTRTLSTRVALGGTKDAASHSVSVRDGKVVVGGYAPTGGTLAPPATFNGRANGADGFFVLFNGKSTPVPPTPTPTRDAFAQIEAESLDEQQGLVEASTVFGYFGQGDWAQYRGVDFGTGATSVDIRLAVDDAFAGKIIELRLDSPTGKQIGRLTVQGTGGWGKYQIQTTSVAAAGVHDLYLVGQGGSGIANVDWFRFSTGSAPTGEGELSKIEAEDLNEQQGLEVYNNFFGYFDNGDWARYKQVDFGSGTSAMTFFLTVSEATAGQTIELRTDSPGGEVIGRLVVQSTGGWDNYQRQAVAVSVAGVHDLYLVGQGKEGIANVDWFSFEREAGSAAASRENLSTRLGQNGLSVYPNPVTDGLLHVGLDKAQPATVVVYGSLGERIMKQDLAAHQDLQLPTLLPGIYTVVVQTAEGTYQQKVVVDRR